MEKIRIKEIARRKDITLDELAKKLGITYSAFFRRINNPKLSTLEEVADALEVPLQELFVENYSDIIGFVEYKGTTYKINSFEDLKSLLKLEEDSN